MSWLMYEMQGLCDNCNKLITIKIRKGVSVDMWIETGRAKCPYCGIKLKKREKGGKEND